MRVAASSDMVSASEASEDIAKNCDTKDTNDEQEIIDDDLAVADLMIAVILVLILSTELRIDDRADILFLSSVADNPSVTRVVSSSV